MSKQEQQIEIIQDLVQRMQAEKGCEFISGNNTVTGDFTGLIVGSSPTTLNIVKGGDYRLNGSPLSSSDNLTDFFTPGAYYPMKFSSITIDSGNVILYR